MIELSIVIPIYNEALVLRALTRELVPWLETIGSSWEVVLVNDGSTDQSWAVMESLRREDSRFTLVNLSRNFGHQLAVTAGMDHACGDAVVVMDADLQDPPHVLAEMVARWREGYDVVYGVRTERASETIFKRASAAFFYRVLQWMTPVDIPVDTGDFRLLSRRAVEELQRMPERARYVRGMVAWVGLRQIGVPYERDARFAGTTKYPLMRMLSFALDGMVSFSALPLRLATSLGFAIALITLGYLGYTVTMKMVVGKAIHGWTSLIAVTALIGSSQLVCLGIVGEYVARIYEEVKGRPLYVVERVVKGPADSKIVRPFIAEG